MLLGEVEDFGEDGDFVVCNDPPLSYAQLIIVKLDPRDIFGHCVFYDGCTGEIATSDISAMNKKHETNRALTCRVCLVFNLLVKN